MLTPHGNCCHPTQRHNDIGGPRTYNCSVAVKPYTIEHRTAHGNICGLVECRSCGARKHENRDQRFIEMSPWWDEAGRREQSKADERDRKERQAEAVRLIRKSYGEKPDMIATSDGYIALRIGWSPISGGGTEILIGTNLKDAVARLKTGGSAKVRETVREAAAAS